MTTLLLLGIWLISSYLTLGTVFATVCLIEGHYNPMTSKDWLKIMVFWPFVLEL